MKRLIPVVAAVAFMACDSPVATDLDDSPAFAKGDAGSIVSGSAHIFQPDPLRPGQEGLRDFTVNVVRRGNGTVGGTMHLGSVASLRPGLSFIGEVTCVTVFDNNDGTKDAWIGGTNRHTNYDGNDLGEQFAVRVRDVGNPQAGSDRVSGVKFSGLGWGPTIGDWACANTPTSFAWRTFAADNGNLTIR